MGSWGLSLFVLFEHFVMYFWCIFCSWGLSLFVLFEHEICAVLDVSGSWGLSLFVLFELTEKKHSSTTVLEGWIYLYYLDFQL